MGRAVRTVGVSLVLLLAGGGVMQLLKRPTEMKLSQPIDCILGTTCVIQQFMDIDAGPGGSDFACGHATYNGHKGTDFRVSPKELARGVNVLAAVDGVVSGMRNNMPDRRIKAPRDNAAVKDKECGNGVVLRHSGNLKTQYCHMKKGSIAVSEGQSVKRGAILGQVGLSGKTEFPHLHLSVRKDGEPIDPFAPANDAGTCAFSKERSLWDNDMVEHFRYQPTEVIQVGMANGAVTMDALLDGAEDLFSPDPRKPMVVFGLAMNGKKGDQLSLSIEGPTGPVIEKLRPELGKRKAQWMAFAGRKAPASGWPAGEYVSRVEVWRKGSILSYQEIPFVIK